NARPTDHSDTTQRSRNERRRYFEEKPSALCQICYPHIYKQSRDRRCVRYLPGTAKSYSLAWLPRGDFNAHDFERKSRQPESGDKIICLLCRYWTDKIDRPLLLGLWPNIQSRPTHGATNPRVQSHDFAGRTIAEELDFKRFRVGIATKALCNLRVHAGLFPGSSGLATWQSQNSPRLDPCYCKAWGCQQFGKAGLLFTSRRVGRLNSAMNRP